MVNTEKNINIEDKKYNLYIIGCHNFPRPSAASTRIGTYGKCLVDTPIKPFLFCLHANYQGNGENVPEYKGIYSNINYEYISGTIYRAKSFLGRRISETNGLINAAKRLIRDKGKKIVMLYVCNFYQEMFFVSLCKLFNIPIIRESSEHIEVENKRPLGIFIIGKIIHLLYFKLVIKGFDGFIVISRYLEDFIRKFNKKAKLLRIPILIDTDIPEFNPHKNSNKIITYCGNLIDEKDGISMLLQSFKEVSEKIKNIKLILIGGSEQSIIKFKKYSSELGIDNKTHFTGILKRKSLFENLLNSDILILTRPNNKQSDAGFPTKLGEYLITGKPVVITETGEIKYFLEDEISAFIAEPGNLNSIVNKLMTALENEELAEKVGINGKKVAMNFFSTDKNKKQIENYLIEIINSK